MKRPEPYIPAFALLCCAAALVVTWQWYALERAWRWSDELAHVCGQ